MGFFDRIESEIKRVGNRFKELDEVISRFSGNMTEAIRAENQRGQELAESYFDAVGIVDDDPHVEFLTSIQTHLMRCAERIDPEFGHPDRLWHINLIDTENMVAFVFPGGFIVLDQMMVEFAKTHEQSDQSQLAFILAHESAHVLLGHTTQKLSAEIKRRIGASFVPGGTLIQTLANRFAYRIAVNMVESAYSKTQEFEADELAVRILNKSNIDPRGGIQLFERLEQKFGDPSGFPILKYFDTHPPFEERIERMNKEIDRIKSTIAKS